MREDYFNDLDNYLNHVKRRQRQWQIVINVLTFVIVAVLTYSIINLPAIKVRANFIANGPSVANIIASKKSIGSAGSVKDTNVDQIEKDKSSTTNNTLYSNVENLPTDIPQDGIYIEKIDTKAPISWDGNSDNIQDLLKKGVVHIVGSATPGMPGNIFVTGHSSDFFWTEGDYKAVFALLDKLENGDKIVMRYKGNNFLYQVYNKQTVDKDAVGDFITTDKDQTLTIMTCYPVGTNWRRLIIQAERI